MEPARRQRRVDGGSVRLLLFLLVGVAAIVTLVMTHDRLVAREEAVDAAWADVESSLQRRADLVPNLVRSLRAHMRYESETLLALVRERAEALREGLADGQAGKAAHLARLEAALSRELAVVMPRLVAMPELRSGDQFLRFQAQLEGSENRVNVARLRYNAAVRDYNDALRGFLGRWVAGSLDLAPRDYFEAGPGAGAAPEVAF
ncbi:LemA family protein [Halomonas beimenensis]|uniref:LemA family protein n=1 Tax=Halomonas beimenensis TaxID=475662 RepID=UPI0031D44EE2